MSWKQNASFAEAKKLDFRLKALNGIAERAVKVMQGCHGWVIADEERKQCLLRCVKEHRKLYPDPSKETLRRK